MPDNSGRADRSHETVRNQKPLDSPYPWCIFSPTVIGYIFVIFEGKETVKEKYDILRNKADGQLVIKEYAEIDKELPALLCDEVYDLAQIETAAQNGLADLVAVLRTKNLYPPAAYAERIALAVMELLDNDGEGTEVFTNDIELLEPPEEEEIAAGANDDNGDDMDQLIDDEDDDDSVDEDVLEPGLKISSLKVADDESVDVDDES